MAWELVRGMVTADGSPSKGPLGRDRLKPVQRDLWNQIAAGYSPDDAVETEEIGPTLDFLGELAGNVTALEFAVGGGRIAVPLYRRGVQTHGMDVSPR